MNNLIQQIEITNFRSIKLAKINCSEYNLFCGLNDVGKSNILKALNLFFNQETDFKTPFNFSVDYNKYALAEAQTSKKKKQLIKIKITFNKPKSYKSIPGSTFFIEKTYDRNDKTGIGTIKYSEESATARTAISRLYNQIRYVYIPALKGKDVVQYLLGLLGEQQLIGNTQIEELNKSINETTKDLSELLNRSNIGIGVSFGLPTLLSDFWQQLSVGTTYEYTSFIENELARKKSNAIPLNPVSYQIPLTMRGDGIKSKFLPPILTWLQNHTKQTFIWGIDEPENSLEFRAAEELSVLFGNQYALTTQIFATSHSMAFINPRNTDRIKPIIFKTIKSEFGETKFINIDDLYKTQNKEDLLDEIGALALQKELITNFRQKIEAEEKAKKKLEQSITEINAKIVAYTKPLIITEGKTDWKHLKTALSFFQGQGKFSDLDVEIYEYDFDLGDAKLHKLLEQYKLLHHRYLIIGVFDCDEDNGKRIHNNGGMKKYNDNVWGISIDIPEFRKYNSSGISIEFLYPDEDIRKEDENNRRLYITSEFNENGRLKENPEIGVKNNHDVKAYVSREKEKIQCDEVIDIHGNSMALSKEKFATKIYKKETPFDKMEFSAFRSIFERIEGIIKGGKV